MQVYLSATLSHLRCVLGDFHTSTDTLLQNFLLPVVFWFQPLFHWHKTFLWNHTYGVVKGAIELLPLQLGFQRFQYISLN